MGKKIKRFIAVIVVCVLVVSGEKLMNYLLVDDTSSYTRLMMHEFYEQDNIDILMVGASHCYRGIEPSTVKENTRKNVFLASSSSQPPDVSFALIKEAVERYDIEQIYLEMSATIAMETGLYKERTIMTKVYLISDYMRPSLNKVSLLLDASLPEYYMNSFWIAKRTELSEFSWETLALVHAKKVTDIYKNYGYDYAGNDSQKYEGNGHVSVSTQIEESKYYSGSADNESIDTDMISKDWCDTILDIIDFCSEKNVKLTLYAAPISNFQLAASGNYDDYIAYIRNLTSGKAVTYVDFNLLRDDCFPYLSTNFSDGDHLNMYGAEAFSRIFSDYINGGLAQEAFHESIREKLEDAKPAFYGIAYLDEEGSRNIRLISNHPEKFEYRVALSYEDKETALLQDFSANSELCIPQNQLGTIEVTYRMAGSKEEIRVQF